MTTTPLDAARDALAEAFPNPPEVPPPPTLSADSARFILRIFNTLTLAASADDFESTALALIQARHELEALTGEHTP